MKNRTFLLGIDRNTKYQLMPDNGYKYTLRNAAVTILEDKTGGITFEYKDRIIPYRIAIKKAQTEKPAQVVSSKEFTEKRVYIPGPDHPWKRVFYASQREMQTPVVT